MKNIEVVNKLKELGLNKMNLQGACYGIDYYVNSKSIINRIGSYDNIIDITLKYNEYFQTTSVWVKYKNQNGYVETIEEMNVYNNRY